MNSAHLKNLRLNTGVISTEHSTPGKTQGHIIELSGRLHSMSLTQDIFRGQLAPTLSIFRSLAMAVIRERFHSVYMILTG